MTRILNRESGGKRNQNCGNVSNALLALTTINILSTTFTIYKNSINLNERQFCYSLFVLTIRLDISLSILQKWTSFRNLTLTE